MAQRSVPLILHQNTRPDPVPLSALIPAVSSFVFPFAALKENRVTDGITVSGAQLAGFPLTCAVLVLGLMVLGAAYCGRGSRVQRILCGCAGIGFLWLSVALLVGASALLSGGAAPRVSPAIAFWGLPLAAYIVSDYSGITKKWYWIVLVALPFVWMLTGGRGEFISVVREWAARRSRFGTEIAVHLRLFLTAVLAAALLGIPAGILASRNRKIGKPLIAVVDAVQTIPSMALFGLLMAPLAALARAVPLFEKLGIRGTGAAPALIALTMYALLPVVRNTVSGIASVPTSAIDAGRGLGMSQGQLFCRVEWPMALPHVLTGLRTASVQAVGNTAVAALIGAGGLGIMIFQGLGQAAPDLILLGVLPLILMAAAADRVWGIILKRSVSAGLQKE